MELGPDVETMEKCCFVACLPCFLVHPKTTCVHSYRSLIKNIPPQACLSGAGFFSVEVLSFKVTVAYIRLTEQTNQVRGVWLVNSALLGNSWVYHTATLWYTYLK